MKQTITESYFIDQIVGDEYNNMSYDGAKALFEYLEELEEDSRNSHGHCELEIEFDRVAIRCEWNEYDNLNEVIKCYDDSINTIEDLRDNAHVIEVPNSDKIIIQEF